MIIITINKPFVHLFKTPGAFYVYDVNTNSILRVKEEIYKLLADIQNNTSWDKMIDERGLLDRLRKGGYLSPKRIIEVKHPSDSLLSYFQSNKLSMIILQMTQQCNLRCKYCVYSGEYKNRNHSNSEMDFETAKKGIDFLIAHSIDSEAITVGFYGGEPLLKFNMIKKCVEYAREQGEGKEVDFTLTTNGTLLNEEKIEYFMRNNVHLTISLDGPKEVHNRNRVFALSGRGSFDKLYENLIMIKEKFPGYAEKVSFSIVIDPENDFGCINDFFIDFDVVSHSAIIPTYIDSRYRTSEIGSSDDFHIKSGYEMFKVYLSKLGRFNESKTSTLSRTFFSKEVETYKRYSVHRNELPDTCHHSGPCVPGSTRLFMSTDGCLYPCERVSESSDVMRIGHIDTGFDVEKSRQILNIGSVSEKSCKNCWAFMYCYMCAAFADDMTVFSGEAKMGNCNAVRTAIESSMRDYCMLVEYGCRPENKEEFFIYEFE